MKKQLIGSDNFILITFASTSHALKAEKVLKSNEAEFMIIPTLREISTSCGLSIKILEDSINHYYEILLQNKVKTDGVFRVKKEGNKNHVDKIDII
ncbi:MAG: DUF3343 domain-containing protein [Syntrophomonadaceae bacterium]|nr:DUF3343 domain-containing protein [Syntrophomonadaceae bacterium]